MPWTFRAVPLLVAGPCVVEEGDVLPRVAERLAILGRRLGIPVCFKASFDKANRHASLLPGGPGSRRDSERWNGPNGYPGSRS